MLSTSTLANQNISVELLIHTWTADAERNIALRVFLADVAGNGDYLAWLTIQRGGAGAEYVGVSALTAAPAGMHAVHWTSTDIPVSAGDVVKVYVCGLATDLAVDVVTEVFAAPDAGAISNIQSRLPAALVGGRMDSNAQVVADKTGYALSAAGILAIWDQLVAGLVAVGSIGKRIVDYLDAAVSSRLSTAGYTAPDNATIATIQADTNDIQTRLPAALDAGRMVAKAEVVTDKTGYELTGPYDPAKTAAQALDLAVVDANVDTLLVNLANLDGDVANLDADVAVVDTVVDAIKVKTDLIGTAGATLNLPVIESDEVETIQGVDYDAGDDLSLDWSSSAWPVLTGASVKVTIDGVAEFTGSVVSAGGATQTVRVQLTAAQSLSIRVGAHAFRLLATQTDGDVIPLAEGTWKSKKKYSAT